MKPTRLVARCFAEHEGQLWVAYCLDFSLACQGDSLDEVKRKMDAQVREYVADALMGEDKSHEQNLLYRRAPLRYWVKYWLISLLKKAGRGNNGGNPRSLPFDEPISLQPAPY